MGLLGKEEAEERTALKAEILGKRRKVFFMTREQAKEEARKHLGDYLRDRGNDLRKNIRCIHPENHNHGDATPSARFYPQINAVKCPVCQCNYDVFNFIEADYAIHDFNGQLQKACELFNIDYKPATSPQKPAGRAQQVQRTETPAKAETGNGGPLRDFTEAIEAANRAALASAEALAYYAGRGLDADAVKRFKLGYMPFNAFVNDTALQVPGWDKYKYIIPYPGGKYFAARSEAATEEKEKYRFPKGIAKQVYYLPNESGYPVVIVEGQFDAMALNLLGVPAAATGGSGAAALTAWAKEEGIAEAVIATDNDEAGETGGAKDEAALKEAGVVTFRADSKRLYGSFKDAAAAAADEQQRDILLDGLQYAIEELYQLQEEAERERQKNTGTGIIDTFLETVQTRRYEPIKTGFLPFDMLTGGLTRQTLVMLAAAPSTGKTTITAQLFEGMARRGSRVIFINLEMSKEQLIARSLCRYAWQEQRLNLPTETILRGYDWNEETKAQVYNAAAGFKRDIAGNLMFCDRNNVGAQLGGILDFLEGEAAHAEAEGKPAPLVVIDYLHIIESVDRNGRAEDVQATIKRSVTELKAFAMRRNTVVFTIIATNRESNKDGKLYLESGRDTSNIEYSADMFIGLNYTAWENGEDTSLEEEKNRTGADGRSCRLLSLKLLKNRMGEDGKTVRLVFDAAHGVATAEV